ncbi:MAG: hypothetical protein QOE22_64 [Candidatus Parcubacteria bacterium]|jgi:ribosomal protein S20|nr:hypothetical protein [Candidatus Parcubacteria bacterium]
MPRGEKRASFDYSIDFAKTDFRKHPELYRIGKGERGVLLVEPYKSEILPHWRFKTPEIAKASSEKIQRIFLGYKRKKDFVGMDMARKFLQMGYTRARRYANHASGRKYASNPQNERTEKLERKARTNVRPQETDWDTNEKAQAARIFYEAYLKVREDPSYKTLKAEHAAREKGT